MADNTQEIKVWDRFVRVFHWMLAACVLGNYFVLEDGEGPHRWSGYLAAALVLSRVVWGFVGSRHARFADFFPTPRRLQAHWQDMRQGRLDAHAGHNPLGALMMLWLMALVLGLGVSGYLLGTDAFWGDDGMQELHEVLANILIGSVGLHVLAALLMSRLGGINLIKAMVTGVKTMPQNSGEPVVPGFEARK